MAHAPAGAGSLVRVLPQTFFHRASDRVAPDLIGCLLVRRLQGGGLCWGVIVETEAYSQSEPACHGHRRRTASNETLFAAPGCFYVYRCYGIHHCVNVVTGRRDWADGVLLRAAAVPQGERLAAGPALLARHFGIDARHDGLSASGPDGLWLARRPETFRRWWEGQTEAGRPPLVTTTRIGIRHACELPWRWYLGASRSVSRRRRGDRRPSPGRCWIPESLGLP